MRRHRWRRFAGIFFAVLLILPGVGWLSFVPSSKEPGYRFVAAWGGQGDGPGQFHDPIGIAVAGGEVFVADSRNGRIQVFDTDGHFRRQFGTPGKGLGQLGRPMNLTIHEDELYVPEYVNDRIQVFGLGGTAKRIIGGPGDGPGQFHAPGGVAVAANGDLFVADFYNHRVQRLSADGSFLRQWGETGKTGHRSGSFTYPTDTALGPDGSLLVADGYGNRIQVFDAAGKFLGKWGGPFAMGVYGPFRGWFSTVTAIALDAQGNVFATDFHNSRIQKFRPDGTFLASFGRRGNGPGEFDHAIAAAVAKDGTVFAVDFANNRVEKWQPMKRVAP